MISFFSALFLESGITIANDEAIITDQNIEDIKREILSIGIEDKVLGKITAPNTIIEYSSMGCPSCMQYHTTTFKEVRKALIDTGIVRYIYRDLPTSRNTLIAGAVAYCCTLQDLNSEIYYDIIDILYREYHKWAFTTKYEKLLRDFLNQKGIQNDVITNCLHNDIIRNNILHRAYKTKQIFDLRYIPTIIVNGVQLIGMPDYEKILSMLKK